MVIILLSNSWRVAELFAGSIRNACSLVARGMVKYYTGNITDTPSTIGLLPAPLYWWEAGAQWGALLDYYHYTGDSQYNNITTQALLSQVGPLSDYMVPAQNKDEGNDDQAFWGFATMSAAEKNYPQPTTGKYSWVELTENLWNTQVARWDNTSCSGGLKWQIFPYNNGYDYKNAISNGAFFQLSARLARFTGNQTYVDWAEKAWDWSTKIGLVDSNYYVYDGADDLMNCIQTDQKTWTYNSGVYMYGAAVMYNYTNGSAIWQNRTQGFLNTLPYFFDPHMNTTNVMYEPPCETVNLCDNDQFSFKGYLSRWYWASTLMAPFTTSAITTLLTGSALAAARACSGGSDGVTCGQHWYWEKVDDNSIGVGQQMSALETIQGLLVKDSIPPLHGDQVYLNTLLSTSQAPVPTPTSSPISTPVPTVSKGAGAGTYPRLWMLPSLPLAVLGLGVSQQVIS